MGFLIETMGSRSSKRRCPGDPVGDSAGARRQGLDIQVSTHIAADRPVLGPSTRVMGLDPRSDVARVTGW